MSENLRQSKEPIAINDKSQGIITKRLRCDVFLYCIFFIQFAGKIIFEIGEHLVKLRTEWLMVSCTPFTLPLFSS